MSTKKAKKLNEVVTSKLDIDAIKENQQQLAADLAISLAPYDFEKAQAYAKTIENVYHQTEVLAEVALAILPTDRAKSLAEIEKLSGDGNVQNNLDRARYRAAYSLVTEDPDLAIELIYQCQNSFNRGQALGRLAVEIAKTDQAKAWKMIDDALVIYRGRSDAGRGWAHAAGPHVAALAYQANSIGYPDMQSVVWHAVAACRANDMTGQDRLSSTIDTARLLALVDKFAARDLLRSIAVATDQIPRGRGSNSPYDRWLETWLLVHFGKGTALIREELEDMKAAGNQASLRYSYGDVFCLLVAAPEDRFKLLLKGTRLWEFEFDGTTP